MKSVYQQACEDSNVMGGMHWFNTITVLLMKNKTGSFYILSW